MRRGSETHSKQRFKLNLYLNNMEFKSVASNEDFPNVPSAALITNPSFQWTGRLTAERATPFRAHEFIFTSSLTKYLKVPDLKRAPQKIKLGVEKLRV